MVYSSPVLQSPATSSSPAFPAEARSQELTLRTQGARVGIRDTPWAAHGAWRRLDLGHGTSESG